MAVAATTTSEQTPTAEEQLERILQFAEAERRAHDAMMRAKLVDGFEEVLDAYDEARERLHGELYRLLDERANNGNPVPKLRMPPDPRKELKKQIVARLKEELPSMVASVIDEF